jgi:hypothetical protein
METCRRLGDQDEAAEAQGEAGGGSMSITQILSLKERFDRADTDGGGSLDMQEFMDAFGSIINKNGSMSGLLSHVILDPHCSAFVLECPHPSSALLAACSGIQYSLDVTIVSPDDQIKRLFMQIDANSDGGIDWQEHLLLIVHAMLPPSSSPRSDMVLGRLGATQERI